MSDEAGQNDARSEAEPRAGERRKRPRAGGATRLEDMIGQSAVMRGLASLVEKVAQTRANVLITGESGTGKDLLARSLHDRGGSAQGAAGRLGDRPPFVAVNCAAIPEGLLESELFGHAKGAFTGAESERSGLFAKADGGALFLDEIGEMSPGLQAKLLRALESGEIRPLGGGEVFEVDVRVITATNRDLEAEIEAGAFRADLYYRLNVVHLHIPPLRERTEDIPEMARTFAARHADEREIVLADDAIAALLRHPWPGNVRELENVIARSILMAEEGSITARDLQFGGREGRRGGEAAGAGPLAPMDLVELLARHGTPLRTLERLYIEAVIRQQGGNKTAAARVLGLDRTTLYRRLAEPG